VGVYGKGIDEPLLLFPINFGNKAMVTEIIKPEKMCIGCCHMPTELGVELRKAPYRVISAGFIQKAGHIFKDVGKLDRNVEWSVC